MLPAILGRVIGPPEVLNAPDGPRHLVEDPLIAPLTKGDPIFGWEGDERYALYTNNRAHQWELWRHEDDGVMRHNVSVPGFVRGPDVVPWLIRWIVAHDTRRGFDPHLHVVEHNTRRAVERDKAESEFNQDFADRFHHALLKDVGHTEVGMTHRQFTSADVPTPAAEPTPEGTT
jgi:hypothetical protein